MKGFVEMSRYAGMREDLVQAGGGNSSFKISKNRMAVKASGVQLSDVNTNDGYAVVNHNLIAEAFLNNDNFYSMTEEESKKILENAWIEGARPSIETFLHAVSDVYTLHTHPMVVNVLACRKGGMDILRQMFPDAFIVPYAAPGIQLAKAYFKEIRETGKKQQAVFLQNHGLAVSAETADMAVNRTEEIVRKVEGFLQIDMSGYHAVTDLYRMMGDGIIWRITDENVRNAENVLGRTWEHAFCPDSVVFLGKRMYDAGNSLNIRDLENFRHKYGEPVVIAYKNDLYIHAQSVRKALEIQSVLSFAAQVMTSNKNYACSMLPEEEQDFLLQWDAEKYRKNMK